MKNRFVELAIGLLMLAGLSALHAQVSNGVWEALAGQRVTLEKSDGSEVAGELTGMTDKAVVVLKPGGRAVSVSKEDIQSVQLSTGAVSDEVWRALMRQTLVLEKSDGSEVTGRLDSVADNALVIVKANGMTVSVLKDDVQNVLFIAAFVPPATATSAPKRTAQNVPPALDEFAVSAGVGGSTELLFNPIYQWKDPSQPWSSQRGELYLSLPVDIKGFIDLTYLQVSAGYMFVAGGTKFSRDTGRAGFGERFTYATLAAYLKYPFGTGAVRFFPLLGVQYRLNLTLTDSAGNDLKSALTSQQRADLDELWIEAGAGMDLSYGGFFIRPEVLVGVKPLSATDRDFLTAAEASGYTDTSLWFLTAGINVLVGYRF